MKFNLTTVVPEGFMHHHAFDEIRDSLSWSLAALGHDVSQTENWFSESGETNLILGAELIADFQRLPANTIIYNLEQPSHPNMAKVIRMVRESRCRVWDYSLRSVEEWRKLGVSVAHVPIGWAPTMTRIPRARTQDIDVCFFGWSTPRRRSLITQLESAGLRVYASSSCYGGARDNVISRSKVCLNVHHDGRDRFEAVRVSYLMSNSCSVVSEYSSDDDEYSDLRRSIAVVPYRLLVDTCASLATDSATHERSVMGASALDSIQKRDFTAAVAVAVESQRSVSVPTPIAYNISGRPNGKVMSRFSSALQTGDMKDFVSWMSKHAKGNVVEIGVRDGASTSAFLVGVEKNGGHVYSIDVQDCSRLFAGHPQWTFIRGRSSDAALKSGSWIDVLLIDGDHSFEGVSLDFYRYSPLVKPGGLILFHDIRPEPNPGNVPDWPDDSVRRFYESLCAAGWEHEELPGRYGMGVLRVPSRVPEVASK